MAKKPIVAFKGSVHEMTKADLGKRLTHQQADLLNLSRPRISQLIADRVLQEPLTAWTVTGDYIWFLRGEFRP